MVKHGRMRFKSAQHSFASSLLSTDGYDPTLDILAQHRASGISQDVERKFYVISAQFSISSLLRFALLQVFSLQTDTARLLKSQHSFASLC